MKSEKNQNHRNRLAWWLPGAGEEGVGGWGGAGQTVQTSRCKRRMFWGFNVQHGEYS